MNRPHWIQRTLERVSALWTDRRAASRTPIRHAWTALGAGSGAEARAGALLQQAIVRQPFSDMQLAAVRARLRRGRGSPVRGMRLIQIAAGFAVMLLAGALFAAAGHFLGWSARALLPSALRGVGEPRSVHRHAGVRGPGNVAEPPVDQPPLETPAAQESAPTGEQAPLSGPIAAESLRPLGAAGAAPEALASRTKVPRAQAPRARLTAGGDGLSLAEESRLLALALRDLRQDNDPLKALATLDDHARRFGQRGALASEADTVRVEALLRLGRHAEGLVRLDRMALAPVGPSRALLAARAELRAEEGRCAAALLDLDRLLERPAAPDAIAERALHGRAACRVQTGDIAGARADLETYLARFPHGRFAADARAALSMKGRRRSSHEGEGGGGR